MTETDDSLIQRQAAIEAALTNNWADAISLNQEILKANPKDIETLNRLGRAYMETGMVGKAKTTYKQVLGIDPYNSIAAKNIEKLAGLTKEDIAKAAKNQNNDHTPLSADLFLEEPGKTKVIEVEDLAMTKILATLRTGDSVILEAKGADIVVTLHEKRLGKLPPDYSTKIVQALKAGSKFSAIIKSVAVTKDKKEALIRLFVRETYHSPKLGIAQIFPSTNNHLTSFVREDSLPLMDNRDDLVLSEGDDEPIENTPLPSEDDDPDSVGEHGPILDDEEDFHP